MQRLRVSENRRFLVYEDGTPFFYLGDTVWELFHRCNREEATLYLQDRAAKRFTVVQAVVLAEVDGVRVPNSLGETPLVNEDPTQPNEAYFRHVDFIVETAASLGLHVGMLPTWGDKWNKKWGAGPEIFTPENARIYGRWIGERYKDAPLIWILGGDRPVETETHRKVIGQMAYGLKEGDGGSHLITFHPTGARTSSEDFHEADWLDFNMWQSGHSRNRANYEDIAQDYALTPTKPCMDAEPGYEDHAAGFDLNNGYLDDYDNRKAAYWALFAGAHGHTYGCHPIWQMFLPGRQPFSFARRYWTEALHLPGSGQMQHVRALLESRPYLTRIPDQSLIASEVGTGSHHLQATRDDAGTYAFIYFPTGKAAEIALDRLNAETLTAHWYDPRTGLAQPIGDIPGNGLRSFTPPCGGPDWVLTLDDSKRGYGRPGR